MGEGNAGGDDAGPRPGAAAGREDRIEGRFLGDPVELPVQKTVEFGEELRRGHPSAGVLFKTRLLLPGHGVAAGNVLAGVADAGRRPEHDRDLVSLRKRKGLGDHLPRLPGRGGVEDRRLGEVGKEAAVLLRLGAVGAGVVGGDQDEPALDAEVSRAGEWVGRDVQPHLLHRHRRTPPRHAVGERRLAGNLLVDRPLRVERSTRLLGEGDDRREDLRGRRPRVGGGQRATLLNEAAADRLVSHQDPLFRHAHPPIPPFPFFQFHAAHNKKSHGLCAHGLDCLCETPIRLRLAPRSLYVSCATTRGSTSGSCFP